jgi:hypothetical protein
MLIIQDFFFVRQVIVKTFLQISTSTKFISVQISLTLFHGLILFFFLGLKTYKQNIKLAAYVPSLNVEMSTGTYSAEAATDSSCFK